MELTFEELVEYLDQRLDYAQRMYKCKILTSLQVNTLVHEASIWFRLMKQYCYNYKPEAWFDGTELHYLGYNCKIVDDDYGQCMVLIAPDGQEYGLGTYNSMYLYEACDILSAYYIESAINKILEE